MDAKILIIEDDELMQKVLRDRCVEMGNFECYTALDAESGIKIVREKNIDIVLLDFGLPDKEGDEVIKIIKDIDPLIEIVIITAYGSIDLAVKMMKQGAADFLTKPVEFERLYIILQNLVEKQKLSRNLSLIKEIEKKDEFIGTNSKNSKQMITEVTKAAKTDTTVLIQGESGTGKEVVAKLIHKLSDRNDEPFIKVDCAVIQDTLMQSELFGHEKGAFTGAATLKRGKIELAHKGTVFFDEIGDLKENMQGRLLRIIQDKEFERVGGVKSLKVNVRIITATNRDLKKMMEKNKYREDLFYRLNVIVINVPPLRNRKEDISDLTNYFFHQTGCELNKKITNIDPQIYDAFQKYPWPGNVRELKNVIERLIVFSENGEVKYSSLPEEIKKTSCELPTGEINYKKAVNKFKTEYLEKMLTFYNWNIADTAKKIGLKRTYLYSLIEQLNIKKRK